MNCFKKDFIELWRSKKNLTYVILPIACALLAMFSVYVMSFIGNLQIDELTDDTGFMSQLSEMMKLSYLNSSATFLSLIATYCCIIYVIMLANLISKEISNKKWILPINAGIKPSKLFLSKLITYTTWILCSILIGYALNFLFTIIFCNSDGYPISYILLAYLYMFLFVALIINIVMSVNFIFKKAWPGVVITLVSIMILPEILGAINIGEHTLLDYTPLVFYTKSMGMTALPDTLPLVISLVTYVTIMVILPLLAISRNKIKAQKQ